MRQIKWFTTGDSIPNDAVSLGGMVARNEERQAKEGDYNTYTKQLTKHYFPFLVDAEKE